MPGTRPLLPLALFSLLLTACDAKPGGPLLLHGIVEVQQVHVASRVAGRVAETLVAEGARVEAGDAIVRLDAPELEARAAEAAARVAEEAAALDRARNGPRTEERDAARAALAEARARLALLRAGPRPEETRAAAAALEGAEVGLARAEEDLARRKELLAGSTITRDEYDAAVSVRDRLLAQRDEARARADLVAAGARAEAIDEAVAAVSRREADLALLEAGTRAEDIAAAEARLAGARAHHAALQIDLAERVIRAPERALLEVLAVRPGDVVAANAPVARLHRAGDLWVRVFLPETEMGRLKVGQRVSATVDSFPGRTFEGTVTWIAARAEYTPRNVQSPQERRHQVFAVKVVVTDPDGVFQSGMAASVSVDADGAR